jgi:predicted acetyltransferase
MLLRLEVISAEPDQKPAMANLLELYAHDFSEFLELKIGEDGRFGYPSLSRYWSEPGRYPFLIRMDGSLSGLVLVKKGSEVSGDAAVWDMVEFFVLRGCRGRGVGSLVAHRIWKVFPGAWEVRVMQRNVPARRFWAQAVSTFAGVAIEPVRMEKDGESWDVFSFQSGRLSPDTGT